METEFDVTQPVRRPGHPFAALTFQQDQRVHMLSAPR